MTGQAGDAIAEEVRSVGHVTCLVEKKSVACARALKSRQELQVVGDEEESLSVPRGVDIGIEASGTQRGTDLALDSKAMAFHGRAGSKANHATTPAAGFPTSPLLLLVFFSS